MNNMITYTDKSIFSETITRDRKQAKLSTNKMQQVRSVVSQAMNKVTEEVQNIPDKIQNVVDELMLKILATPKANINGNINANGTRKIRVNSLITDSIKKVRESNIKTIEDTAVDNIDMVPTNDISVSPVLETKQIITSNENVENNIQTEKPLVEPVVSAYQAPLSRVNKVQPAINNEANNIPSVDAYLQRISRDGSESIETLEMDNQKLIAEINNKKSYLAQLEEELQKIEKEKRIKDLEEEKLGYTSTLQGLSDQIRKLQTEIEEKKQSYGR